MASVRNSAKAIIIRDGKLLCIECTDSEGAFYLLPGGGQEHGETLTETLRRECREEVSAEVVVHDLRFIREYLGWNHDFAIIPRDRHHVEFMFFCTLQEGSEPRLGVEPDGTQTGIAWLPLEDLSRFRLYPSVMKTAIPSCPDNSITQPVYLGDVN